MELILKSEKDIQAHVAAIQEFSEGRNVWLFVGEMGVGKTTTIKNVCEALQVTDTVSSPTFSIVNEYFSNTVGTIYHFDCYRIENNDEVYEIGIEDYFYSGYICMVEWPEKIQDFIPEDYLILKFDKIDDSTRRLTVIKNE